MTVSFSAFHILMVAAECLVIVLAFRYFIVGRRQQRNRVAYWTIGILVWPLLAALPVLGWIWAMVSVLSEYSGPR